MYVEKNLREHPQEQKKFCFWGCNCRIFVSNRLKVERLDWLPTFGFRGGTTIHLVHGHHPSADSGLSLANDKRARVSVVSPRLGQQPARLVSQRHTPLHVGAQLTAQSTGWQASASIFSLCKGRIAPNPRTRLALLAQAKIHVTKRPGDGKRTFCARCRRH